MDLFLFSSWIKYLAIRNGCSVNQYFRFELVDLNLLRSS